MIKTIIRLLLFGTALYLFAALVVLVYGLQEDVQPVDVGVVFGNKVERSGVPSLSLASRLDKTISLYQRGVFQNVIVSGGVGKEGWDEAQVMADYLSERGVPREVILVDSHGNNTYLTAQNTAALAKSKGFHSFVLISHFYHLPRARLTFQSLNLSPVFIAHAERFVARDFYYGLMREVIAYPVYLVNYARQ